MIFFCRFLAIFSNSVGRLGFCYILGTTAARGYLLYNNGNNRVLADDEYTRNGCWSKIITIMHIVLNRNNMKLRISRGPSL